MALSFTPVTRAAVAILYAAFVLTGSSKAGVRACVSPTRDWCRSRIRTTTSVLWQVVRVIPWLEYAAKLTQTLALLLFGASWISLLEKTKMFGR
jgi:hypothetical protein